MKADTLNNSTGYGNHGDYVFGWKDDSLQKIMDEECYVNCKTMRTQSIAAMNSCTVPNQVDEDIGDKNCKSLSCVLRCIVKIGVGDNC